MMAGGNSCGRMPATHINMNHLVIAGLVISIIVGWLAWRSSGVISRLLMLALAIALLVPSTILGIGMNPWLVDARYRSYRQFYWSIQRGMSRQEVMDGMERRYPLTGPRKRPNLLEDSATSLSFAMHPETAGEPNRETIALKMQAGEVTGKNYLPDR